MQGNPKLDAQNPWPGLRSFTETDRDFFFGREREIAELLELVQQSPTVVLYGQSGLGKTSLLQAGLFPELKRLDFLPFRVRFNLGEDAPPLSDQIKIALTDELDREGIQCPRPSAEETLWEYFHRRDLDLWGPGNRLLAPLIVVDQFEEVFTLGQRGERSAAGVAQFAADLESVLEQRPPQAVRERLNKNPDEALDYDFRRESGKFVISLREDFLGYLDSWCRRIPSLLSVTNRFRLQAMTGAQALEVVERGGRDLVDDAVAQEIVGFVSDARHRVAPALLSVVLEELNHRRMEHRQTRITAEFLSFERGKIIQDFYERSFEGIDPRVRVWVEDRLLTGGGHRQPAALEDALSKGIPEGGFDFLVERRVLQRADREGVVWLELTHDLLSDPASRSRAQREQRQQVEEAARQKEQFRRELGKSRKLAAVFGALLLVAVAACLLVIKYNRQAKQSESKSERMQSLAAANANRQLIDIVSNSSVSVAAVEAAIKDAEDVYGALESQKANSGNLEGEVEIPRARFLARAADALYEGGHFADGLHWSSQAMAVLVRLGPAGFKGEQAQIARAEILYEEGRGSLELNKLDEATADFTDALALVSSVPKWKAREDTSRVFILSQIGLGDRYSNACTMSDAIQHFNAAYGQAQDLASGAVGDAKKRTDLERSEAVALKIRASLEMGASQWDPLQGQSWYSTAQTDLQNAAKGDLSNPRWKALSGLLAYHQAEAANTLNQSDKVKSKLDEATTDYQELINRDPLNWQWQLMLAKSRYLLARLHINLKEWDLAESSLNQSQDSATELLKNDDQSTWVSANLLHISDLESLSTLPLMKLSEALFSTKAVQDEMFSEAKLPQSRRELEASFQPLSEAESILKTMQSATPKDSGCSVSLAEILHFRSELQDLQAIFYAQKDKPDAQKLQKEALSNSLQGLQMLEAVERRASQSNLTQTFISDKGGAFSSLASVQGDLDQQANQIASEKDSIAAYQKLVKIAPRAGNYKSLSNEIKSLGELYEGKKDYSAAYSQYEQAMSVIEVASAKLKTESGQRGRGETPYSETKSRLYGDLASVDIARGDVHRALGEINNELVVIWQALPTDFTNQNYLGDLENCKTKLESIQKGLQSSDPQPPYRSLDASQKEALLTQVKGLLDRTNPRGLITASGGVWSLRPSFPGAWRTLARSEYASEGVPRELAAAGRNVTPAQVLSIRGLILDFYGDSRLYEVTVDGVHGTLFYLRRGKDWVQLKGDADAIKVMNGKSLPQLDTVERAAAYLRFYLGTVQNTDLGPDLCKPSTGAAPPGGLYSLVDQEPDVPWLDSATVQERAGVVKKIQPLQIEESPDHEWQARGTVECRGDLFHVTFRLSRSGILNASQANRVYEHLPVKAQFFSVDNIRTDGTMEDLFLDDLKRNPADQPALESLIDIYDANKHYEKEEQVLLDVMKRSPLNHTALGRLVDLYQETKQPEKEEALLLGALKQEPENGSALESLMDIYDANKQYEKEEHVLLDVMKRSPLNHTALGRLVDLYQETKQPEKEEALLLGARKQAPENESALRDLMWFYNTGGQYGKEEALLDDELKRDPSNEGALMNLPRVYFDAKDWNNAVQAEDNWIAHVQGRKVGVRYTQGALNSDLSNAYAALAWYQIFAQDFTGALASAEAGIKLNPTDLDLAAKRAEALLFLNRNQEADAIVLGNRGKKNGDWGLPWDEKILEDFDRLERGGLTSPEMARLRTLLSATPTKNPTAPAPGLPQQNARPN